MIYLAEECDRDHQRRQLCDGAGHVVNEGGAYAVRGSAGAVGRFCQRQMMLKAGLAGVDGAVAAVGAGEGLGRDFMTAFGAGFKHDKYFLSIEIETNKKCAAEAAHEKCMAPCCDTIVFYFERKVYENRAYIFTLVKMYTYHSQNIQLCRTIIIAQAKPLVNTFFEIFSTFFKKFFQRFFQKPIDN